MRRRCAANHRWWYQLHSERRWLVQVELLGWKLLSTLLEARSMMAMETQRTMISIAPERLHAFRSRSQEYLRLGHDRLAAARFVADAIGEFHGTALDIATGKGLLAIELARRGMEVISVDVDSRERELAQLLAEEAGVAGRISFEQVDAANIPYSDGQFGCVAMMDVLHHPR
jgi:2-polyprenyl-3-methyl-5-hydroxy-6-metoxy-1,4-benzoquinol methylase